MERPPKIKPRKKETDRPNLDQKEREKLRAIFSDPVFQKAMGYAAGYKPGVFCSGVGSQVSNPDASVLIANNRLHEIRGWEMFENALFLQAADPLPAKSKLEENYPDQGRIDHAW